MQYAKRCVLPSAFYSQPTLAVAKKLLGKILVHDSADGLTAGVIVETEAYLSDCDPACHAHKGKTQRNAAMFNGAGCSYVYLIYGMYYCFNVVTGKEGVGEAVLVRALEPIAGLELMQKRRKTSELTRLCSGPAKLAIAMGISKAQNALPLTKSPLTVVERKAFGLSMLTPKELALTCTTRIGISCARDLPYRFYLSRSNYVSQK